MLLAACEFDILLLDHCTWSASVVCYKLQVTSRGQNEKQALRMNDLQSVRAVRWLRQTTTISEERDNVPVVDIRIRTDTARHQFPQHDAVRPLSTHDITIYSQVNTFIKPTAIQVSQAMREAATICPAPCKLTFDLLTLKVVSESRVTWATSTPILVFLCLFVLDLGPMYTTDRQTSDSHHRLMPPPYGGGA